uniref:Uncharacterized protein n=1 Tax=Anguilla anguilla TaxID=7936 RepID=A0A0E9PJ73_ANGAN
MKNIDRCFIYTEFLENSLLRKIFKNKNETKCMICVCHY